LKVNADLRLSGAPLFNTIVTIGTNIKRIVLIGSAAGSFAFSTLAMAVQKTVTLNVPGMTCSTCPIVVKKALMKVDGVQKVQVNYENKEAVVNLDDSIVSVDAVSQATGNAGFPSTVKAPK
jgi:mercuric ion binding protein